MTLEQIYNHYFAHRIAASEADRETAYRLRYRVYCEETGFLSKADNPGGLEVDRHDAHSVQCLLNHRPSGLPVGTVRLVLPRAAMPGCDQPARVYARALDMLGEDELPRARTAEISRFAIVPEFRKRQEDGVHPGIYDTAGIDPRRIVPNMTLGLMSGVFEMALANGMTHLCAIIDPGLLRILTRLGLRFNAVGPAVEFHGRRQPVYASLAELERGQGLTHPEYLDVLSQGGLLQAGSVALA